MSMYHDLWFKNDCNNNCAITYPLTEQSIVIDLGAYKGVWASQIIEKYNPIMYLVEPDKELCNFLKEKYASNPKVKVVNFAVSDEIKDIILYKNQDGSSFYLQNSNPITVKCLDIKTLLDYLNIKNVDLIQINIEGEEYKVLKNMFDTNTINNFNNLQIQFHDFIENSNNMREEIQEMFYKFNFKNIYDYPFVFEAWKKDDNL